MQLDWAINTYLIHKKLSHSYQSKHHMWSYDFSLWLRITIIVLVLQLIWYCSTGWVSNIGDLVLVLVFKFRILNCGWFWMLRIIARNLLKIGNGWAIVEKYAPTVVLVGAHSFAQFLENFRSHSNASSTLIFSEKKDTHLLNLKKIDNSTENMSGITDGHQNYERCDCNVKIVIGA